MDAHSWIASHPGVELDVAQIISTFKPQKNLHVIKFENDKFSTLHHQRHSVGTPPIIAQAAQNAVAELIAKPVRVDDVKLRDFFIIIVRFDLTNLSII